MRSSQRNERVDDASASALASSSSVTTGVVPVAGVGAEGVEIRIPRLWARSEAAAAAAHVPV